METLYKERPELKIIDRFGYQCNQELSGIVSVCRFGDLDVVEGLTGRFSRKTKKAILDFRARDTPIPNTELYLFGDNYSSKAMK
jgi:hypothetical protein